jgi:hypothetical protein
MSTRVVSNTQRCCHPGCTLPGDTAFASHPDDKRCADHHQVELRRRLAAVAAAAGVFKALVG